MPPEHSITTERLTLRRLSDGQAQALEALANNWEVAKQTTTVPFPYARADAVAFIAHARQAEEDGEELILAIERTCDRCLLGVIGLVTDVSPVEVGYWLGEAHWGKGYASEALRGALKLAVEDMDVGGVEAVAFAENRASVSVLRKCGFVHIKDSDENFPDRGGMRRVSRFHWTAA